MKVIGRIEQEYSCGPSEADGPAESSYHPLTPLSPTPCIASNDKSKANNGGESANTESSSWLPCHYFDYVAGTSTGGYVSYAMDLLNASSLFPQVDRHHARAIENEC